MSVYIKFVLNLEKRRIKQIIHIRKSFLDEDGFWLYILKVWINIEVPVYSSSTNKAKIIRIAYMYSKCIDCRINNITSA
jgi:hypothetical protein